MKLIETKTPKFKVFLSDYEDVVFYVMYHKYAYTCDDIETHLFSVIMEDAYQTPEAHTLTGKELKEKYKIDLDLWKEKSDFNQ